MSAERNLARRDLSDTGELIPAALDAPPRRTHLQQAPGPGTSIPVLHNRGYP